MAKKILIIEDEHILSDMYADEFASAGWQVATAATQDEGLAKTKQEKPDLVLLDILLYDGHGLQYLKTKKEDEDIARIPVLVFSNFEDSKTQEQALQLGALEYLLKTDYTPQELMAKVKQSVHK